jgi:hypothetical protein
MALAKTVPAKAMALRIRRKSPADIVQTLTIEATKTHSLQPWQGNLLVSSGGASGSSVDFTLNLAILATQLEGTGVMKMFPRGIVTRDTAMEINGSRQRLAFDFEIWVHAEKLSREPIQLSGAFNRTLNKAKGTWHIRCFNPGTCDCLGTRGEFKMWKAL